MLNFSKTNRKINELADMLGYKKSQVIAFDLPAGYTCPMADKCKSMANRENGKITDGKACEFRCYAASIEAVFTATRNAHWQNFEAIKNLSTVAIANLILAELPKDVKVVRIHASGDFFSKRYFLAWVKVAESRPDVSFFGYTKVLDYVSFSKPDNFKLVYSYGGKMDSQLTTEPYAMVVKDSVQAKKYGLTPACKINPADDYLFIMRGDSFALTLHGTQPARS